MRSRPCLPGIVHHTWKDSDLKNVEKAKFNGCHGTKEEVYTYGSKKGLEFLVSKVMLDFLAAAARLNWNWHETFNQFPRIL
jgi:hypothetical protein